MKKPLVKTVAAGSTAFEPGLTDFSNVSYINATNQSEYPNSETAKEKNYDKYDIIAATGCPTGIAHAYMAQGALEQAAKKAG